MLAVTLGATLLLVNRAVSGSFQDYVEDQQSARLQRAESILSRYYDSRREWVGVAVTLRSISDLMGERLVLADAQGRVVADSLEALVGEDARDDWRGKRVSVRSHEFAVGTLYINPAVGGLPPADPRGQLFLAALGSYLAWAVAVGLLAATALSVGLARWLAGPLEALTNAARRMERGQLQQRIDTSVGGEVGALADAFNSLATSLARVERLRQNMVTDIAHELRTPLSSIRGYLEAIQDGVVEPNRETLDTVHRELMQLTRLVDDLQELSLAEARQLQLDREEVDVAELVDWEVRAFRPQAAARQVELDVAVVGSIPRLELDPGRISQVLGNILRNALAHTPSGGRVRVDVARAAGQVTIGIDDTGPGIAPADLEHIFERFYRADRARSRRAGELARGTGLGLTIARELVRAHGGSISAKSTLGRGTRFQISLPISRPVRPLPTPPTVRPRSASAWAEQLPLIGRAATVLALFGVAAGLVESLMASTLMRKPGSFLDLAGYAALIDAVVFAGLGALGAAAAILVARLLRRPAPPSHVGIGALVVGVVAVGLLAGYRWHQLLNREAPADAPETLYPLAMILIASVLLATMTWSIAEAVRRRYRGAARFVGRRAIPATLALFLAGAAGLVAQDQASQRLAGGSVVAARAPAAREPSLAPPLAPEGFVEPVPPRPSNVLLLTVSGLRADHLGAYGYDQARTPNIDALARSGVHFRSAYTPQPDANPAHAAILSGTHPTTNGVRADSVDRLDPSAPTVAQALVERGYRTAAIYSWVSFEPAYSGLDRGFQDYLDLTINRPEYLSDNRAQVLAATYARLKAYLAVPGAVTEAFSLQSGPDEALDGKADVTTEAAIAWLELNQSTPFFLWVHYVDPRYPYSPPAPFDEVDDTGCGDSCPDGALKTIRDIQAGGAVTAAQINHLVGLYDGEIAFTDQQLGRLLERLDRLGLKDDTLVILTADGGQSFAEHDTWLSGSGLHNAETRVPLIVAGPGVVPSDVPVATPITTVDVAPTILAAAGAAIPSAFQGRDLAPLVIGRGAVEERSAVSVLADNSQVALIDGEWKLIWSVKDQAARLYYLPDDPNELNDRAKDEPETVTRLLAELETWRSSQPGLAEFRLPIFGLRVPRS